MIDHFAMLYYVNYSFIYFMNNLLIYFHRIVLENMLNAHGLVCLSQPKSALYVFSLITGVGSNYTFLISPPGVNANFFYY